MEFGIAIIKFMAEMTEVEVTFLAICSSAIFVLTLGLVLQAGYYFWMKRRPIRIKMNRKECKRTAALYGVMPRWWWTGKRTRFEVVKILANFKYRHFRERPVSVSDKDWAAAQVEKFFNKELR